MTVVIQQEQAPEPEVQSRSFPDIPLFVETLRDTTVNGRATFTNTHLPNGCRLANESVNLTRLNGEATTSIPCLEFDSRTIEALRTLEQSFDLVQIGIVLDGSNIYLVLNRAFRNKELAQTGFADSPISTQTKLIELPAVLINLIGLNFDSLIGLEHRLIITNDVTPRDDIDIMRAGRITQENISGNTALVFSTVLMQSGYNNRLTEYQIMEAVLNSLGIDMNKLSPEYRSLGAELIELFASGHQDGIVENGVRFMQHSLDIQYIVDTDGNHMPIILTPNGEIYLYLLSNYKGDQFVSDEANQLTALLEQSGYTTILDESQRGQGSSSGGGLSAITKMKEEKTPIEMQGNGQFASLRVIINGKIVTINAIGIGTQTFADLEHALINKLDILQSETASTEIIAVGNTSQTTAPINETGYPILPIEPRIPQRQIVNISSRGNESHQSRISAGATVVLAKKINTLQHPENSFTQQNTLPVKPIYNPPSPQPLNPLSSAKEFYQKASTLNSLGVSVEKEASIQNRTAEMSARTNISNANASPQSSQSRQQHSEASKLEKTMETNDKAHLSTNNVTGNSASTPDNLAEDTASSITHTYHQSSQSTLQKAQGTHDTLSADSPKTERTQAIERNQPAVATQTIQSTDTVLGEPGIIVTEADQSNDAQPNKTEKYKEVTAVHDEVSSIIQRASTIQSTTRTRQDPLTEATTNRPVNVNTRPITALGRQDNHDRTLTAQSDKLYSILQAMGLTPLQSAMIANSATLTPDGTIEFQGDQTDLRALGIDPGTLPVSVNFTSDTAAQQYLI